jgi:hypothetical protein
MPATVTYISCSYSFLIVSFPSVLDVILVLFVMTVGVTDYTTYVNTHIHTHMLTYTM